MKFPFNNQEYYIDGYLASQLDTIIYNLKNDWDFVILVTGDRMVRVGKSVLGMHICAYLSYRMNSVGLKTSYTDKDIYYEHKDMVNEALEKPQYSINHYDEGKEGLSKQQLRGLQKDLLDFFSEAGQLNHIFVIVLPDYFDLIEDLAVARSEFLVNVYRKEVKIMTNFFKDGSRPVVRFDRGQFDFYSRSKKERLYDLAKLKRQKNYRLIKSDFRGRFTHSYPLDEQLYREKKRAALKRFKERKKEERARTTDIFRDKLVIELEAEGKSSREISTYLDQEYGYSVSHVTISKIIKRNKSQI